MISSVPHVRFGDFLKINLRPVTLASDQDADLVGVKWYGAGPFHREHKSAINIIKKSHFLIRTGDVIYNKLFAWKGSFGIVSPALDGMYVSDKFPTYSLDRTKVDENYLKLYFHYSPLWDQARDMSTGSAALSKFTLNPPKFLELTMPLPSLVEQRGIVAELEKIMRIIEEIREKRISVNNGNGSKFFQKIIDKTIISSQGYQPLSNYLINAPRYGYSGNRDYVENGIAILTLSAVTGFQYQESYKFLPEYLVNSDPSIWLKKNDLLISRSNTPELVGHAAIYSGTPYPCVFPDLIMRINVNEQLVDKKFLHHWLQSSSVRHYIMNNARGTSPTMKKISQKVVQNIPFPSGISLTEQRRIVTHLDHLQAKVDAVKRLQAETEREMKALIPAVLAKAFA